MDSIFRGDLRTAGGRAVAWLDSMLVDHGVLRLVWGNWGVVVPGRMYRCNHPTPGRLARAKRRFGLRSLINLRGMTRSGSDALSREQAGRLGLAFFDVPLSSGQAPSRERLLALAAAFRAAPQPALLHCKSGADRAGFAGAVFVLLEGGSVRDAMRQMSLRHGHLRNSRAGVLDALLLRYQNDAEGRLGFLDWVANEYDPEAVTRGFKARGLEAMLQERILRRE